jgi:hypothetical protein
MANKPEHLYDQRTLKRNLDRGLITQAEVDARLAELEDCAEHAQPANVRFIYTGKAPVQEK